MLGNINHVGEHQCRNRGEFTIKQDIMLGQQIQVKRVRAKN